MIEWVNIGRSWRKGRRGKRKNEGGASLEDVRMVGVDWA